MQIIDTLKDSATNHTAYVYTAGQGLKVYRGAAPGRFSTGAVDVSHRVTSVELSPR